MTPEIERRLADFERRHKPDSRHYLNLFREEIVYLHHKGYSLKATFEYLKEQGVGCSLRTFERWVKDSIDFAQEPRPTAVERVRPWPAESSDGQAEAGAGEGGAPKRVGQFASQPLVSNDTPQFSLAGARAGSPTLQAGVAGTSTTLPKPPLLVDKSQENELHSSTEVVQLSRQAKLERARELREAGFKSPVERALDPEQSK